MCARYVITSPAEAIRALFGYADRPNFPPRYNVAPTQPIPIVYLERGRRVFALARWGFLPSWVKDPRTFSLLVNARGESVNDKPAFRSAMRRRRCLIPADGFYEWSDTRRRRPFFVRPKDGRSIAFAGLWETWSGPSGEEVDTAAIVTTRSNRQLAAIHDRMPVIVPLEAFDFWLDCAAVDATTAAVLFVPASEALLESYEVSTAVNRAANDSPDLIAPAPASRAIADDADAAAAEAPENPEEPDRQLSLF
jgi:putative SOS response-associated peptidase YedK